MFDKNSQYIEEVERYVETLRENPARSPMQKKIRDSARIRNKFWFCEIGANGYPIGASKAIYRLYKERKEPSSNGCIEHWTCNLKEGKHSRHSMREREAWWNEAWEAITWGYDGEYDIALANEMSDSYGYNFVDEFDYDILEDILDNYDNDNI